MVKKFSKNENAALEDFWSLNGDTPTWSTTPATTTTVGTKYKGYQACYHTHPELKFTAKDGKEYGLWGGNCTTPIVHDADIYIGFAGSVANGNWTYPWEKGWKPVVTVDFYIQDMHVPKSLPDFIQLVDWTCDQLAAGKKIHAGCMGGHGRTGLFFAAVVAQMTGMKDAIQYVRKHYCHKAVETNEQIQFLMKNYGCSNTTESKPMALPKGKAKDMLDYWGGGTVKSTQLGSSGSISKSTTAFKGAKRTVNPVASPKNIWI